MPQELDPNLTTWTITTDYATVHTTSRTEMTRHIGEAVLHRSTKIVVTRNGKVVVDAHLGIVEEEIQQ